MITGRLSRLSATGTETVLIEDFCQQYPSHSVGSIDFGPDGMLYVSSGDGASFNWADYGQDGSPVNPCGDPPGGTLTPPTSQGGALRAQSFRRPASQTASLDGAILRVNPDTGAAAAGNPAIGNADPQRRRIVAYGFRNPFRFTFRPGTGEIWSGDVGWNTWEEINRTPDVTQVRNYGWPCYEGTPRMGSYDSLNLNSCETLYSAGRERRDRAVLRLQPLREGRPRRDVHERARRRSPASRSTPVTRSRRSTRTRCSSATTRATASGSSTRARTGSRTSPRARRSWPAPPARCSSPRARTARSTTPTSRAARSAAWRPTTTRRRRASPPTRPPAWPRSRSPSSGTTSSDPENQALTYAWDLDGDGAYDDSTAAAPSFTYTTAGTITVRLRVSDPGGLLGTTSTTITVGAPPTVTLAAPAAGTTWAVGDTVSFSGSARNSADATLPASALRWSLSLRHCSRDDASVCHTHAIQDYVGVASGSFVAPDHEYPSHLLLSLTARRRGRAETTETVRLDPRTANITLASSPTGLQLSFGFGHAGRAVHPHGDRALGELGQRALAAGWRASYLFGSWSDGLGATHAVTAPASGTATYTATFSRAADASLAGADVIGTNTSSAPAGRGEVYRTTAGRTGVATSVRIYLDGSSRANQLDPRPLRRQRRRGRARCWLGRAAAPAAGAWNTVTLATGVPLDAGTRVLDRAAEPGRLDRRAEPGATTRAAPAARSGRRRARR